MNREFLLERYSNPPHYKADDFKHVKLILLNGPPGSGKDTAANYLAKADYFSCKHLKMSEVLYRSVFVDFGLPYNTPLNYFESVKNEPLALFYGKSLRQRLIEKSENWMKPICGQTFYGQQFVKKLYDQINDVDQYYVVSDSGFLSEILPVIKYVPAKNVLQLKIHAEARGCNFDNDSRSYWSHHDIHCINIYNNSDVETYLNAVDYSLQHFYGPFNET